jgi:membrane protein YdbS with pleckstrin-like domain
MVIETTAKQEIDKENTAPFSNQPFSDTELPTLKQLTFQSLAPIYLKTNRLVDLFSTMTILLILFIAQQQPLFPLPNHIINILDYVIYAVGSLGLISTLYVALADKKKNFALREQDITYRSGLIFQKSITQPILRIQHVELKRGPIERKVGLASLQVFSAGGAAHTFEIPGLLLENAESIRQFILDHKTINNR